MTTTRKSPSAMKNTHRSTSSLLTVLVVALLATGFTPSAMALGWPGTNLDGKPCRGLASNYGPFDYTDPFARTKKLKIVESYHFTPAIRQLAIKNRKSLYDDIGYTLRAFPNHHPALYAMMRLQLQDEKIFGPPMMCYFNRAETLAPGDYRIYLLKGIYLHRLKKLEQALEEYKRAEKLNGRSAELAYNMGLLYFDMGDLDKAVRYAKKAYDKGYPLPGLRIKLQSKGKKV